MTFVRTYKAELILIILSLVIHLICFAVVTGANNGQVIDAVRGDDGYFELAENVLAGNGFSWSTAAPYAPNPLRTPGYIYFLAGLLGVTGSITATALIQLLLSSAIPIFGMYIAEHITLSRRIGMIAGIILALDPTLALLSFQFYTETLFLLLFLPWLLLTFRYIKQPSIRTLVISAILLGGAILTKASAQYIPLLFIPFIMWKFGKQEWQRGVVHAGVYLFVIGAILAPWIMRNVNTFGEPGLSAQTPFVLYTNLAPAILSVAEGSDFTETVKTFLTPAEYKGDAITLANGDAYAARAFEIVRAHPHATAYIATKSLFTFFTNDGFYGLLMRSGYAPWDFLPLLIGARLVWVVITLTAFVGSIVYLLKERSALAILTILLVAYFALTSTIAAFGTNPRYRLPVDPIIIAFAAVGGIYLLNRTKKYLPQWVLDML